MSLRQRRRRRRAPSDNLQVITDTISVISFPMKQIHSTRRLRDTERRPSHAPGLRPGWALALLLTLSACGGGGGGDSAPATGSTAAPAASASDPAATLPIDGVATFESVPSTRAGLTYGAGSAKPIRGAVVEIVDGAGATVATTVTNANGAYRAFVRPNSTVSVRIKAQTTQSAGATAADVSVRDNTNGDAIYALQTPAFDVGSIPFVRNVSAPSGWTGNGYGAARAAAPFAILDTIYTTQAKLLSVAPATAFPPLQVFWSVNNRPAAGNAAQGDIGSTAFTSNARGFAIYVLGRENVDTDEYDASVVAHEWGHYYQAAFSRDDSIGGPHSSNDRLDFRVAFSEGWGNAWSGIALGRDDYTDSFGPQQAQAARTSLSNAAVPSPGWFREDSIQSILWNLNQQVGFKGIHDAFTGTLRRGAAVTSIHSFAAAYGAASPNEAPVLARLLGGQAISPATNDAFGTSETNNGGVPSALPLYRGVTVGGSTQVCVNFQAGTGNRLGNFAYLRFTAPAARTYAITATGGAGSNPSLAVWGAGSGLIAASSASGSTDSVSPRLPAGDIVISVNDINDSIASPCFTVTIQ